MSDGIKTKISRPRPHPIAGPAALIDEELHKMFRVMYNTSALHFVQHTQTRWCISILLRPGADTKIGRPISININFIINDRGIGRKLKSTKCWKNFLTSTFHLGPPYLTLGFIFSGWQRAGSDGNGSDLGGSQHVP